MSKTDAEKQAARIRAVVGEAEVMGALMMGKTMIEYFVYVSSRTGFYGELTTKAEVDTYLQRVAQKRAAQS